MDKQLACATFATLIPVLLIAGYLVDESTTHMSSRYRRRFMYGVAGLAAGGELVSILGVGATRPAEWMVAVGQGVCIYLMFGLALVTVARAKAEQPPRRDSHS